AVAMRQPFARPLAALGADQLGDLGLHQLLYDPAERLTQEVQPLALEQVADDLLARHPLRLGIRGASPLVVVLADSTSLSATVAGPTTRLRPTRSYTTLWDVTWRGSQCGQPDTTETRDCRGLRGRDTNAGALQVMVACEAPVRERRWQWS